MQPYAIDTLIKTIIPLADVLTLALAVWMMTKVIRAQKAQMAQETA